MEEAEDTELCTFKDSGKDMGPEAGQRGEKIPGNIIHTACTRIYQRFSLERNRRGRPQSPGPQKPTAVEKAAVVIVNWAGGAVVTEKVVEEAWRERWLKGRDGRAAVRPADDFNPNNRPCFRPRR